MKKRLFTILFALCAAVCLLTVTASAEEIASGTCGENLTWVLDDEGTLTISGTGAMTDFIGGHGVDDFFCTAPWYDYRYRIKEIKVDSGVTAIGSYAFYQCTDVEKVSLPNTLVSIGDYAFSSFGQGLEPVMIPEGVTHIGNWAFQHCSMKQVTLPSTLKTVGEGAFSYTNLVSVDIPGSLEVIPEDMFFEVRSLNSITLHEGLKRIESGAFGYCWLDSVVLPSTVEYVEFMAFSWASDYEWIAVYNPDCVLEKGFYYPQHYGDPYIALDAVIYGYAGSTAQVYAEMEGLTFAEIPAFTDLPANSFYFAPVAWAVNNGITKGMTDTTFVPDGACTRGQVVTFLWRAAGCPGADSTSHPFVDVKEGAYYYQAMLWALENGITNGVTPTTFEPDKPCDRGTVVTFLYRAKGKPAFTAAEHPFTDVDSDRFYYNAMLWAVENGIAKGMTATTFVPDGGCTRGQVVTFLCRAYAE